MCVGGKGGYGGCLCAHASSPMPAWDRVYVYIYTHSYIYIPEGAFVHF